MTARRARDGCPPPGPGPRRGWPPSPRPRPRAPPRRPRPCQPDRGRSGGPGPARVAAGPPGPASGRRCAGRPVPRRLHHPPPRADAGRLAGPAAADGHRPAHRRPRPRRALAVRRGHSRHGDGRAGPRPHPRIGHHHRRDPPVRDRLRRLADGHPGLRGYPDPPAGGWLGRLRRRARHRRERRMTGLNGDRGDVRVLLAAGVAVVLLPVLLLAAVTGLVSQQASACASQPPASAQGFAIPARYMALSRQARRASADYLQASGATSALPGAIFAYNHSAQYATDVLGWAARYARGGAQAVAAAANPACAPGANGPLPPGVAGKVITFARAQIGKPYQFGGTGPDAFDCSGLTMMAYRAAGIILPRTSQHQWAYGKPIPPSHVRP